MPKARAVKPAVKQTKKPKTERRRATRGNVKLLTAFRAPNQNGFVRALNLSTYGALLESPDPFSAGQTLDLEFLLDENQLVQVAGTVLRVNKKGPFYLVAVGFGKLSAKIKRLITSQIAR